MFDKSHILSLKNGGVGVIPTDTLYGLVCSVHSKDGYKKLVSLKGVKKERKSFIILIADYSDLEKLGINCTDLQKKVISKLWPGPFSIEMKQDSEISKMTGFDSPAVRMPAKKELIEFLKETGPLFAPSANPTDMPSSTTVDEAKRYFGEKIDFYVDGGILNGKPSTVMAIGDGNIEIFRQGEIDPMSLLNGVI